jgi:hypothetical protein
MSEEDFLRPVLEVRDQPAEEEGGCESSQKLSEDKPRYIGGPDSREGIA